MNELVKAELDVLDRQGKATDTVQVQFNPTTMRLQLSNSTDGGESRGRQVQQYNGSASTTLSLDLEFDTADEGDSASPVDVRSKTAKIAQFMLPGGTSSKQAPPRVRFRWGGAFELTGVMTSLSEELSLFSREGVALRAKVSIQIKEQDSRFEALETGAGASPDTQPAGAGEGSGGNGPGSSGGGPIDRAAAALAGETAADFLARNGLAPGAWRALGAALDVLGDGIELEAGLSIGFDSSMSIELGGAVTAGLHVGLDVSADVSLGLSPSAGPNTGDATLAQGFALSAAGGVTAAGESAKAAGASAAADRARASFGGAPAGRATTTAPTGRTPLAAPGATPAGSGGAAPAPPPPRADRRSTTFGLGVPLRDRVQVPGAEQDGYVVLGRLSPIERSGPRRAAGGCGCRRCGGHR